MLQLLRRTSLLLILCIPFACATTAVPPPLPPPEPLPETVDPALARAELLWDEYGVPHIFAKDPSALYFAFGWAQMRSHGDLLLRLYGQARGRAAEYWGDRFTDSDTWVRTNGVPERAEEWWTQQRPHIRAYIEAFVAGVNTFAERHPEHVGAQWRTVLPVQPIDVLAHMQRVLHFSFFASPRLALQSRQHLQLAPGSNAWAIAPARSASGHAMLLANPHLPWSDIYTFYEAHLVLPDVNAYGAATVGMPLLAIAFNERLGWTLTVNTIDGADLFDLETRGDVYFFDDDVRPFDVAHQTLRVRQTDGSIAERRLTIRRSVHGPVIAERDGRAIALRVAGIDQPHLLEQFYDMMRARSRGEFEVATSQLQLPMFTIMYADADGDIMHVFNGRVPVRSGGDWSYWQGIVPGGTSATLWTETHRYFELPRVLNPASGWLQNANDPPWTTTLPFALEPFRFPAYMAPQRAPSFRALRSMRMLAEDDRITFDELVQYKHSTRMEAADHIVQDLAAAARAYGDDDARAAADVLERWDRHANADSRGAVLFANGYGMLRRQRWPTGSLFDVPWTPRAPLATPDGLADPRRAASILGEAARHTRTLYGTLDIAWGDVFRLRRDTLDLPASGGDGELGIFRVLDFAPLPTDSTRFVATGGDSFVAAIEFATPPRALALLGYGNASQPGSPHRTDQLPLAARQLLRPVHFTRDQVEQASIQLREYF